MARLRAVLGDLGAGRGRLLQERGRLIDALGAGRTSDGILERIAALDEQVREADGRLADVERDLDALLATGTDAEALAAALREFDRVWDVMATEERSRAVTLLLEAVVYDGRTENVELEFRPMPATTAEEAA